MRVKRLSFKREYRKILESGQKITTIRIHTDLKSGDLVELVAGGVSCGYARVKSVTRKKVSELNERDAVKDGFKNVKELVKVLRRYYKEITPKTYVYIIRFEKEKQGKKQV